MNNRSILEKFIENPQTALLAYERREVDWYPGLPTSEPAAASLIQAQRNGERDDVHFGAAAGTYFYKFNCRENLPDGRPNPLGDPRVRRALSMAVDRKTIVEKVTRVFQPIAMTFVPPGAIRGYEPPVEAGVSFDPEGARKLLAEAGYPGGKGLEGLQIYYNTAGGHESIAQAIRAMWQQHLGFELSLKGTEVKVFQDDLQQGRFIVARAGWFGDYRYPTTFLEYLHSRDGHNHGKYHNPEYDRLLEAAAAEGEREKALALLREAEALMLQDQPIVPINHYMNLELYRPAEVTGLLVNPWNVYRLEFVKVRRGEQK